MPQKAAREYADRDVCRLADVRRHTRAGPDRFECAPPIVVRAEAAEPAEWRGRHPLGRRLRIRASGIGLTEFDEGIRDGNSVAIHDAHPEVDVFARRAGGGHASQAVRIARSDLEKRSDRLRRARDEYGIVIVHTRPSNGVDRSPRRTMSNR